MKLEDRCPACGVAWPVKDGGYGCESCTREYYSRQLARLQAELDEAFEEVAHNLESVAACEEPREAAALTAAARALRKRSKRSQPIDKPPPA